MKPDKNFKLPKTVKRRLATMTNSVERNVYKNQMIQAELHSKRMERVSKKDKSKSNDEE